MKYENPDFEGRWCGDESPGEIGLQDKVRMKRAAEQEDPQPSGCTRFPAELPAAAPQLTGWRRNAQATFACGNFDVLLRGISGRVDRNRHGSEAPERGCSRTPRTWPSGQPYNRGVCPADAGHKEPRAGPQNRSLCMREGQTTRDPRSDSKDIR